jgi:hypothetical protein
MLDRLSTPQPTEERKFFGLDAAKINGEIQTMNCQKDLRRFKLRHRTDPTPFSPFMDSVACKIWRVVPVFYVQQQVVHRIMQLEEPHIRLNAQLEIWYVDLTEVLGAKGGLCPTVKGFDICHVSKCPPRFRIVKEREGHSVR